MKEETTSIDVAGFDQKIGMNRRRFRNKKCPVCSCDLGYENGYKKCPECGYKRKCNKSETYMKFL